MKYRQIRLRCRIGLMGLLGLIGLVSCSDDPAEVVKQRVNLELQPCAVGYEEEAETRAFSFTRSDPPTSPSWAPGYYLYDDLNGAFEGRKDLMHKSIGVFFAQEGTADPDEGTFFYNEYDEKWHLNNKDITLGNYFLYGFIPTEDAESATIEPNSTFEEGAVLTIHGLNAVTPSDVCVIIGAREGEDENTVSGLKAGSFATYLNPTGTNATDADHNYIFLLFDHLYSALRFQFTIDTEYAKLRTIKLRKLELVAYSDENGGGVKAKYDATITLKKNNSGTTPIVGNISFDPVNTSDDVAPVALYEWDGDSDHDLVLSTTAPREFMGTFVPGDHTYFKLRSTYDVYDRAATPNLIRQHCQAENTIDLRAKFQTNDSMRGHSYSYTIKVQPTYLYVLSEPDLDNPTVTIGN